MDHDECLCSKESVLYELNLENIAQDTTEQKPNSLNNVFQE
jgi:hypothetical protein